MRFHQALHPNQRLHLRVQTVAHELKLSIRGYETNRSVVLESRKPNTLVELDVFHLDSLAPRSPTRCLEHNLVVQPQAKLRHTTQITLHLNGTQDLGTQHIPSCGYEEVQRFDDIEEDFVLAVADTFASPRDSIGDSNWRSCLDFELVRLLGNVPMKTPD